MPPLAILAIDPGPERSAYALMQGLDLLDHGIVINDILRPIKLAGRAAARGAEVWLAVEMVASYGMPVGAEVFETCVWIGRFVERWGVALRPAAMVYRREVKLHLCQDSRAKDSNIRQAILDLYPRTGGGARPQIGTKKQHGPLYGVSKDVWAAIGVGLTWQAKQDKAI